VESAGAQMGVDHDPVEDVFLLVGEYVLHRPHLLAVRADDRRPLLERQIRRRLPVVHGRTIRAGSSRDVCFNSRPDAEDEDALRLQEALPQALQRQVPRSASELEPHPREEIARPEAAVRAPIGDLRRGSRPGQEAARWAWSLMPRSTNAVARKRRKKKVLDRAKGYFGRKHSSYRLANEQLMRSDAYAYRDPRTRKPDVRPLWITRINAAARQEGMSYSQLMNGLKKAEVDVNRKILADIAVNDPEGFRRFVELAREAAAT